MFYCITWVSDMFYFFFLIVLNHIMSFVPLCTHQKIFKKKSKTKKNGFLFYIHLNCVSRGVGKARHLISVVIVACIHYSPLPLLSLSSV